MKQESEEPIITIPGLRVIAVEEKTIITTAINRTILILEDSFIKEGWDSGVSIFLASRN
jgi:hypothetical protein